MTMLECLDGLAALLTTFDKLPECDPERCMDMTVCSLTQSCRWMDGCLDGWTDLCGSVLSSRLSVF